MSTLQLFDKVPDVGTTVRLDITFKTLASVPELFDPDAVILRVKDPEGIGTLKTVQRGSLGRYFAAFVVTVAGQWRYRFESQGPTRAVNGSFVVRRNEYTEGGVTEIYVSYGGWDESDYGEWADLSYGEW